MPESTIAVGVARAQQHRWLVFAGLTLLCSPLLLHPSVPQLGFVLREWGLIGSSRQFGYVAHLSTYALLTASLLLLMWPGRMRDCLLGIGLVSAHAIATETAQLGIAGRDFDLWDLACNLAGIATVVTGWALWCLAGRRSRRDPETLDIPPLPLKRSA